MGHPSQSSAFKAAIIFPMKEGGREKGRKGGKEGGRRKIIFKRLNMCRSCANCVTIRSFRSLGQLTTL